MYKRQILVFLQVRKHLQEDQEAATTSSSSSSPSHSSGPTSYSSEAPAEDAGTLASDEALAALREKLTGH